VLCYIGSVPGFIDSCCHGDDEVQVYQILCTLNMVTHPRVYVPPSTPEQAVAQIETWMESPMLSVLSETKMSWWNL